MQDVKLEKINAFRNWCMSHDVMFRELANGHFHIMNSDTGKLIAQVWATTEKLMTNEGPTIVGIDKIHNILIAQTTHRVEVQSSAVSECRQKFLDCYKENRITLFDAILVVAIHSPTGATDIVTSHYDVEAKMEEYIDAYDDQFRLKANGRIQITGFMLV